MLQHAIRYHNDKISVCQLFRHLRYLLSHKHPYRHALLCDHPHLFSMADKRRGGTNFVKRRLSTVQIQPHKIHSRKQIMFSMGHHGGIHHAQCRIRQKTGFHEFLY